MTTGSLISRLSSLRSISLGAACLLLPFAQPCPAAESFEDAMARATLDYTKRMEKATEGLANMREKINAEKAPLLKAMRTAEDRIIAAETEISRMDVSDEQAQENRRRLLKEFDSLRKNFNYLDSVAGDSLKALRDGGLPPGEAKAKVERLDEIQRKLDGSTSTPDGKAGLAVADFLLDQLKDSLGGYTAQGRALVGDDKQVTEGSFIFVGPEAFFVGQDGKQAGAVRYRDGASLPIVYPLPLWKPEDAQGLALGKMTAIVADSSGGKALKLMETKGTLWEHIRKGGVVAFAILGIGLLAVIMILQKMHDLSRMAVDGPHKIKDFLAVLSSEGVDKAREALQSLGPTSREIFARGLKSINEPKELLEEHLYAVLLRQRLHFERRLPLLAVIATAAPLMGLLGTVMGMVKTFALITVFGTGNAGKLASGISEVLVATELGLMVAIPTLVAHGFLSHRIQKNLALLERYALEFVSAAQTRKPRTTSETVTAK